MRFWFSLTFTPHPLADADTREKTLAKQMTDYARSLVPVIEMGVEPISKNRIAPCACPRCQVTTQRKRAKPRQGKSLKNDFSAKQKRRREATVH